MAWPDRLETARLILRPLDEADLPTLVREIGRWEVARWLIRVPHPYAMVDARQWLEMCRRDDTAGSQMFRAVEAKDGTPGALVGGIGLIPRAHGPGQGELGYWFAPAVWGRGYATEAGRAMVAVGFRDLGLATIQAAADPANTGSNRVLEKCGMTLLRTDPAHDRGLRGPPGPANLWRITRDAWSAAHG